jgi:hypothetical protein
MGEEAFYGVAGDIVGIISPVSEASREATLSQFWWRLLIFSNEDDQRTGNRLGSIT